MALRQRMLICLVTLILAGVFGYAFIIYFVQVDGNSPRGTTYNSFYQGQHNGRWSEYIASLLCMLNETSNPHSQSGRSLVDSENRMNIEATFNGTTIAKIFDDRRRLVEHSCKANKIPAFLYYGRPSRLLLTRLGKQALQFLLVDDRHKIILCSIPKVASTSWKRFLVEIGAIESGDDASVILQNVDDISIHSNRNVTDAYYRPLGSFHPNEIIQRLKDYTKIIFVRHPISRLVATWKSKLSVKNPYYNQLYGKLLISKYRDATDNQSISNGFPVTLAEFFRYLSRLPNRSYHDVHWISYFNHCGICSIRYDYIGQFESVSIESEYIMSRLCQDGKLPSNIRFPQRNKSRPSYLQSVNDGYDDVLVSIDRSILKKVIRKYAYDFEFFGYDTELITSKHTTSPSINRLF